MKRILISAGSLAIVLVLMISSLVVGANNKKIVSKQDVFGGKAWAGKTLDQMEDKEKKDKGNPTDTYYEFENSSTYKSVLEDVKKNWARADNLDTDVGVETLLADFSAMSYEDRLRYGVWDSKTWEGKAQKELLKGKTLKEAKQTADPKKEYWK